MGVSRGRPGPRRGASAATAIATAERDEAHAGASAAEARLGDDARRIFAAALDAVRPEAAARAACAREPALHVRGARPGGGVFVLALGKAALPMARGALAALGGGTAGGVGGRACVEAGTRTGARGAGAAADARVARALAVTHARAGEGGVGRAPARCAVVLGDHPLPGARSRAAADAVGAFVGALGPGDVLLVLLSGGTSALIGAPIPEVAALERSALRRVTRTLLEGGASIDETNALRRRLGRWAGGRLAAAALGRGARVVTLALSDVPGDAPHDIGSGPTVPDPTSRARAAALARRFGLGADPAVHAALAAPGAALPPGAVRWRLLGGGAEARRAAEREARALGYRVARGVGVRSGEAAEQGARMAGELRALARRARGPVAVVESGELSVNLRGDGPRGVRRGPGPRPRGGRCQEAALAAALALEREAATEAAPGPRAAHAILCAGTDGRDGPTSAAGALTVDSTAQRLRALGLRPEALLARHDSYRAFAALGALVVTGPTGTNVADLFVRLARPASAARRRTPPRRPSPRR